QRELGEQNVLLDQEVRHSHRREEIILPQVLQLTDALEKEEKLRGERETARIAIEALKKGVLLRLLEHEIGAVVLGKPPGQRGLAHADRPFHYHVTRTPFSHFAPAPASSSRSATS